MAYIFRGTNRDIDDEPAVRIQKLDGFDPSACGTYAGYRRHQKHGIPACQDCKDAMAAYTRSRYVPAKPAEFNPDACGTWAGWNRHQYHDVPLCEACRQASRDYQKVRRVARKKQAA